VIRRPGLALRAPSAPLRGRSHGRREAQILSHPTQSGYHGSRNVPPDAASPRAGKESRHGRLSDSVPGADQRGHGASWPAHPPPGSGRVFPRPANDQRTSIMASRSVILIGGSRNRIRARRTTVQAENDSRSSSPPRFLRANESGPAEKLWNFERFGSPSKRKSILLHEERRPGESGSTVYGNQPGW
jgi:hypothetical protein